MHRYIPISTVEFRSKSLNAEYDSIMENKYVYTPNKKSSYSKKKEFLEFCNNTDILNDIKHHNTYNSLLKTIKEIFNSNNQSYINETLSIIKTDYIPKMVLTNAHTGSFLKTICEACTNEDQISSILETVSIYKECDRVINNDRKLSNRFNFNKYITENSNKSPRDLVFALCEMIDTYNIPLKVKYNTCLENIQYSLYKAGIDCDVVKNVTDYFLLRESVIPDVDYEKMNVIVTQNQFTNPEQLSRLKMTKNIDRQKYIDKIQYIRDKCIKSEKTGRILDQLMTVDNEEQADFYIKTVYNMLIQDASLDEEDKIILKKSINMLPLISSVDKAFVDYSVNKLNGSLLSTRDLLETVSYMNKIMKNPNDIFGDYYKPSSILESFLTITPINIKDYIEEFKADQDKSPERFVRLLSKLEVNDNNMAKSVIDQIPEIFDIIKYTYVYSSIQYPEAVYKSLSSLIDSYIRNDIDPVHCADLIKVLQEEKKKIEDRLSSVDDYNVKDKTEEYNKLLDDCMERLNTYIESYNVPSNESFTYSDDNMSFEAYVSLIESLINGFEEVNKINKEELLSSISDNIRLFTTNSDNLRNLSNIIMASKVMDKQEYGNLLRVSVGDDPVSNSNIKEELIYIESYQYPDIDIITESFLISESLSILNKYFVEDAILEADGNTGKKKQKLSFNDLRLAFKSFQAKIKDLSAKDKAFWRNIDMYGSTIIKSIQKALTSDRREAIIKGSIIPSMSKCIKTIIVIAGAGMTGAKLGLLGGGPMLGVITAIGIFASSKFLNGREKQLIYDEIDTELKVLEKEINMAEQDGDMNKYRFLLQYQKKLTREKSRIKYGATLKGMAIPNMPKRS